MPSVSGLLAAGTGFAARQEPAATVATMQVAAKRMVGPAIHGWSRTRSNTTETGCFVPRMSLYSRKGMDEVETKSDARPEGVSQKAVSGLDEGLLCYCGLCRTTTGRRPPAG